MNRHKFTLAFCALSSILANYVLSDSPPLDFDYDNLNILLINAYERLPFHIEEGMAKALSNLQLAISVVSTSKDPVTIDNITDCLPAYSQFSTLNLMRAMTNTKTLIRERITVSKSTVFNANNVNFIILIEKDPSVCAIDRSILAAAKPCPIRQKKRPILAIMNICLQNDWKDFGNTVDLFRHEILHGLGFGTLNVIEEHKKSLVKDETYIWNTLNGPRKAARVYMDYSKAAVPVVQRHFGCSNIRGVEAENTAKIHLNEYIFGNELMTPFLSRFNYFSEISAAILESTFIGSVQWYKVDRKVIEMENQSYWYGRNWGCEFALRSCFDYIAEMQRQRKTTFPFCSLAELRVNKAKICFVDLQSPRRPPMQFVSTCEPINANVMPLSVQRLSSVEKEAVDQLTRHCPFITALIDDVFPYRMQVANCQIHP